MNATVLVACLAAVAFVTFIVGSGYRTESLFLQQEAVALRWARAKGWKVTGLSPWAVAELPSRVGTNAFRLEAEDDRGAFTVRVWVGRWPRYEVWTDIEERR